MSEDREWMVSIQGKQSGPFTESEIRVRLASKDIPSDAHVWKLGFMGWEPISSIFQTSTHPPPPPAPSEKLHFNPEALNQLKKYKRGIIASGGCFVVLLIISLFVSLFRGCSNTDSQTDTAKGLSSPGPSTPPSPFQILTSKIKNGGDTELRASAATIKDDSNWMPDAVTKTIKNLKVTKSDSTLTISFDVDMDSTHYLAMNRNPWSVISYSMPLLVRLFDENGQYLTHFTTAERFMGNEQLYLPQKTIYEQTAAFGTGLPKPVLLTENNNQMQYTVNTRDLRDASIVEVGFIDPD